MVITLNGRRVDDAVRTDCLQNLLDDIRSVSPVGDLIVGLRIDGAALGTQEICDRLSTPLPPDCQVDVESGPREAVVAEALMVAADEITAAAEDQRWAAEEATTGDIGQALHSVAVVAQVLQGCQSALIQSAELLARDLRECMVDGAPLSAHLAELTNTLSELRDALESRDTVLLNDLLRGEVADRCARWGDRLRALSRQIAVSVPG